MSSSLGFPRSMSLSLPKTFSFSPSSSSEGKSCKKSIPSLDRYLTNEGHRLVVSYIRNTQIQNNIIGGQLFKIEENDIDELIKSYKGTPTPVFHTLRYDDLHLALHEMKNLSKLLKGDKITNIHTLQLTKNQLCGTPLKLFFNALRKNSTVTKLDLSFNFLGDREVKWLAKVLKKNQTLREVYLASNKIGVEGAKLLAKALKENNSLERFSIEQNRIGSQGAIAFAEMLKTNKTLKYIHFGGNNLGIGGTQVICEALKVNQTLLSLSLDVNNIGKDGARLIGGALLMNKTLTHLYLGRNNIQNEGLQHICRGLDHPDSAIIYLDLEFNGIGGEGGSGGESLAKLLDSKSSNVPRAINLVNNPVGDEGCEQLAKGFYKNTTLESIILSHCNIGLRGITAISESLIANRGLQNLTLDNNNAIGADGHALLADALEKNTTIKGVQLDYNFADWEHAGNSIQASLTRNHFLQQEKYAIASQILVAARTMFHSFPPKKLSSSLMHLEFHALPFEIRENILFALDANNVLTHSQKISIINFARRKDTLGTSRESFLLQAFHVYYPLTLTVRLWPTEASDFDSSDRY
ncbi:3814_t:CDS:1 [Ambispora gerdemannii]|uniref:3814_t:CDS:1 n=1 Tax=Ambispora gerdemannii TaxID=144530 RepID=A0A9N9CZG2_9GLOM|nr:3814_t:CDS:1 [Ambispora gerdemannii]